MAKRAGQRLQTTGAVANQEATATQTLTGVMSAGDNSKLGGYDALIKNRTGEDLSNQQALELLESTGLPKDYAGEVWIKKIGGGSYQVESIYDDIDIKRTITPPDKVKNDFFFINKGSRFDGRGGEIFENQVDTLSKKGYKQLAVNAGGVGPKINPSSEMNGYYTWLRMGYKPNAKDEQKIVDTFNSKNRENGVQVKSSAEMMSSKYGRDWWKDNGFEWDGTFDLTKGSYSMKTLENYRKAKKASK